MKHLHLKILLMRHGETWDNQAQRMQGQRDRDPAALALACRATELSGSGQQQVLALGGRLGQRLKTAQVLPQIYASPLRRSRETVALLAETCFGPTGLGPTVPLAIHYDERLAEIDLGIFSGLTWPEAEARYPALCQTLLSQLDAYPVPEAETPQHCHQRAEAFVQALVWNSSESSEIWIVTHAGILAHLVAAILGSDRTWGMAIAPTALFEFELNRDRWLLATERLNPALWTIHHFNDTAHLGG
ncbi:MAG: histidine phosphatase family protein [Synechococcales cyanobacterium CRU_2_2]|nr:histidine phosphatase family protein [Synechococcales cyanobacterium CRU_2_2]